jgi:hypothetical protein
VISEQLIARIRAEYREMPGLQLTAPQASRLWQEDRATCEHVLQSLVKDGFLLRTERGTFVLLSSPARLKPLKASLPVRIRTRTA